jgi:uncharacterized protein (DUF302 family)
MKIVQNFLATIGLTALLGIVIFYCTYPDTSRAVFKHGGEILSLMDDFKNAPDLSPKAWEVYQRVGKKLAKTGNIADATVVRVKVDKDISVSDVEEAMALVANELNVMNVAEQPLSAQVAKMTGKPQKFLKIVQYCDPLTAVKMVAYSQYYSAYLPCRITIVEDDDGQIWLYTLDMDLMIHGGAPLPESIAEEANRIQTSLTEIMNRGAAGDF